MLEQKVWVADPVLADGKHILIVDDDIRNIFALTSLLERYRQLRVRYAETGTDAIEILQNAPGIIIVLSGCDDAGDGRIPATVRAAQAIKFKSLPIIALTAKTMKGDRENLHRCGRIRLHSETGEYGTTPVFASRLAVPIGADG